jgi:hypothetical protein
VCSGGASRTAGEETAVDTFMMETALTGSPDKAAAALQPAIKSPQLGRYRIPVLLLNINNIFVLVFIHAAAVIFVYNFIIKEISS